MNVTFDHGALFAATSGGSIYECRAPSSCPTTPIVRGAALFDGDEYRFGHRTEGTPGTPHRIMRVPR